MLHMKFFFSLFNVTQGRAGQGTQKINRVGQGQVNEIAAGQVTGYQNSFFYFIKNCYRIN
jgi:hypothetical protein